MSEQSRDEMKASFAEMVAEGKMKIVGERDGEPLYALTAEGELHVENILDDVLERATEALSSALDIPTFMARDLLIHCAAKLKEADA